ncbi:MAG: site-specific DNA-methyltransferase [Candidatus Methanomethylophilaceae archaeon]|nr:site-specific DNA-methyltransferase [Candidatus Methanomethylophilaceae archaeon]
MSIREVLVWAKNVMVLGRQDYQHKHEPCLYGWKEGQAHYFIDDRTKTTVYENPPDIGTMSKEDMRKLLQEILANVETTVIHENKPTKSDLHPTMKPVKLIAHQIVNSSRPGEIVLDPFGGSGSTLIACEHTGRQCRMMELDPHYCDVIVQRWEALTGRKAEKVGAC